ncbi:MAG TPA: hypothetical protein PK668_26480 [Myxococcota bacterium]|nr:hypothetical protein [Myxococcota bacterium]HRY97075.1 hypothetical protein [Myxococcota bacterium]
MEAVELTRLKQAYTLLGVLPDSSALGIRRAYGRQARTWRSDRWPEGSPQRERAVARLQELKQAFRLIRHAPLRYHVESPGVPARAGRPGPRHSAPVTNWFEWIVRFACGAAFGLLVLVLHCLVELSTAILICVPLATGLGSALLGDRFWHTILRSMLWWA